MFKITWDGLNNWEQKLCLWLCREFVSSIFCQIEVVIL